MSDFAATTSQAYATEGAAIDLGRGVHDPKLVNDAVVRFPLRMMNRRAMLGADGGEAARRLGPEAWGGYDVESGGGAWIEDVEE